ncbi:hypothetical protein QVD17_34534 [Tagetes erecta]|uniref:DUF7780 domain-containing protein n=1 Tax=Tagetes erecta TaxID=13708 RepID=A0AAD8NKG8_TARER|nr:hypothetical protein QVD17_34534 [Tagetes erecta]
MKSPANLCKRTTVGRSSSGEGWGMGFLFVFFPQQHDINSSPPFKSPALNNALLRRSSSGQIIAKAQSTISVCALVIFFTLLLFTLCNFEPTINNTSHHYRRHLTQFPANRVQSNSHALNRLGTLYTRGTKPMNDLVICHVPESVTVTEVKSFLRAFHRSGLFSKSDLVFIFPSFTTPELHDNVIREENKAFIKLVRKFHSELSKQSNMSHFPASFDLNQFVKLKKDLNNRDPIWGRKTKTGLNPNPILKSISNWSNDGETELTRTSYGSVVGFGVGELDPENSLSGFMDHVSLSLRRWASYPMLLGRVRRNFKHVILVNVKHVLLIGDALTGVKNTSPETVFLSPTKHNHKTAINPSLVTGGARGVRRLSAAMLTEIVRHTTRNKRKTPVSESAILSRLATNEFVSKNIRLVTLTELIPEVSSLSGVVIAKHKVIRRGNSNIDVEITKRICSFTIEASVYMECGKYNFSSV